MIELSLKNCAGFFVIVFCGFYLRSILISPIYISTIISVIFITIYFLRTKHCVIKIDCSIWIAISWIIYLVITQIPYQKNSAFYNLIFSILYYVLSTKIISILSTKSIIKFSKWLLDFSILLLIAEAALRIRNPIIKSAETEQNAFYRFKYNSIMYQDSNYVGVFILVLFFFTIYLESKHDMCLKKEKICYLILSVLTFSRSAIIVVFSIGFLFDKTIDKFLKVIVLLFSSIVGIYLAISYILIDASFISKLDIIKWSFEFFVEKASLYMKLFGYGLGHSIDNIGIGSHNLFVTYIMETGIVGFIFWGMSLMSILKLTKKNAYYIIIPFLIAGFSFASHFAPFLYCTFSIMIALENSNVKDYIGV